MPVGSHPPQTLSVLLCELAGGFILAFALWKPTVVICKSCGLEIKMTVHVQPLSCFLARLVQNWICRITHSTFPPPPPKSEFTLTKLPMRCFHQVFMGFYKKKTDSKTWFETRHLCKKNKNAGCISSLLPCCLYYRILQNPLKKMQQNINFYFNMTEKRQKKLVNCHKEPRDIGYILVASNHECNQQGASVQQSQSCYCTK